MALHGSKLTRINIFDYERKPEYPKFFFWCPKVKQRRLPMEMERAFKIGLALLPSNLINVYLGEFKVNLNKKVIKQHGIYEKDTV